MQSGAPILPTWSRLSFASFPTASPVDSQALINLLFSYDGATSPTDIIYNIVLCMEYLKRDIADGILS